ncbi:MAG: hypothetical protein RMJ34_06910 [candidate division WOR-3 bacterium]|nr:hypothetical protein [candidate division WOR-3 bacterium]
MKTRTIVWTIVGIVVVAGVIFTIISRRQAGTLGPYHRTRDMADWQRDYQNMVEDIEKFQKRYERVKGKIASPTAEESNLMSQIDAKIAEWRTETEKFNQLQTEEERKAWWDKVTELRKEARKLLRTLRKGGEEEGE